MKYIILLVLITGYSQLPAQQFVSVNNTWVANSTRESQLGGITTRWSWTYRFTDSITSNGESYLQLERMDDTNSFEYEKIGLFREENKKVYKMIGDQEKLIYDFNLVLGDTVLMNSDDWATVEKIDSFELERGEYRNKYSLYNLIGLRTQVVDGIGSLYSPIDKPRTTPDFATTYELVCFLVEDRVLYSSDSKNCNNYISSVDDVSQTNYSIRITDKMIYVDGVNSKKISVKLFDITGKPLQQFPIRHNAGNLLDTNYNGLAICQLFLNKEIVQSTLIYIQ